MTPTEERFSFMLLMFKIGGFPLQTEDVSLLQSVYNMAVTISTYSVYLTVFNNIYINMDNVQDIMAVVCHAIIMIEILFTELIYRIRVKEMQRLLHLIEFFTWEDMPVRDLQTGELTMAGLLPRIENFVKKSIAFSLGVHIVQNSVRVFWNGDVMYDTVYPFDVYVSPVYQLILITQVMTMLRMSIFFFGAPYIYVTFVCIACTQLEKVKNLLLLMNQRRLESGDLEDGNHNEELHNIQMQQNLNSILQLHQQVISYIRALEEMMSLLLGGVLFLILLGQCTAAFAAILNLENINDFTRVVLLYLVITGIAFIYCEFGTILSQEYESVSNAALACDWVGTTVPFQKCLIFMISMSSQGFMLTAAKFVPVSNSTLMSMINESISLFMFFLTMKDKNE